MDNNNQPDQQSISPSQRLRFGVKAVHCLYAAMHQGDSQAEWYEAACSRFSPKAVARKMRELENRGYLRVSGGRYSLTDKGLDALNEIMAEVSTWKQTNVSGPPNYFQMEA